MKNIVEIWVANNPNEIQTDAKNFCERFDYEPISISITYDSQCKCYVAACVLQSTINEGVI